MNKINNQFTSIEQITDRYLGTGKGNSTVNALGLSFEEILKQKQDVSESLELKFSKHASMRLENRKINLSKEQSERLESGVQKASEKYPIQMEILSFIQIDKRRLLKNVSRIFNKAMPYLP